MKSWNGACTPTAKPIRRHIKPCVLGCLEAEDDIDELTKENDELEEEISKIQLELDDVKDFCRSALDIIDDADETDLASCVKALDAVASIIEREIL